MRVLLINLTLQSHFSCRLSKTDANGIWARIALQRGNCIGHRVRCDWWIDFWPHCGFHPGWTCLSLIVSCGKSSVPSCQSSSKWLVFVHFTEITLITLNRPPALVKVKAISLPFVLAANELAWSDFDRLPSGAIGSAMKLCARAYSANETVF